MFSVDRGEFFGLLGPNGAGKTTTIHFAKKFLAKRA
ncbi:ATP-binding cassette domain-containing protein [Thermodesulfobacteriota bacterium]